MGIILAVFSGFVLALVTPWTTRATGRASGWIYSVVPAGITVYLATLVAGVAAGETTRVAYPWVPGLNVDLSFYVDGLSLFFALLITGIGTLIFIYAGAYLRGHHHLGRFFSYLSVFMAAMVGLVLADNLFTFYIFFELTSFASFVLIGFNHDEAASRRAAWQALLVTKAGGLALLVGFLLMEQVTGTLQISAILETGDAIREHGFYTAIVLLVIAGAFTKSAQFPFYFWLPNAMQAPTPVSAYLHSATMVKAGIYVLARFHPVLAGPDLWIWLVGGIGALTMLLSAWLALQYTDMKGILAYTTIMALGLLTMLLGLGTETALKACLVFVLVHAFYKAGLFMVAGAIDHSVHERDVTKLGGLRAAMPATFGAAVVAGLSMAGIPLLFGFVGKELIYEATLHFEPAMVLFTAAALLANVALVASAGLLVIRPFMGATNQLTAHAHRPDVGLWIGPAVLAVLSLGLGLAPWLLDGPILAPALSALVGMETAPYLAIWHGFNAALGLSAVTIVLGVATYMAWEPIRASAPFRSLERWLGTGLDNGYDHAIDGLLALARAQTDILQNGYLRRYLATILVTTVVAVGYGFGYYGFEGPVLSFVNVASYEWVLSLLIVGGASGTLFLQDRVALVTSLGITGFGIALVYLMYGAPDLAMTQFLVETLTVILFVLVLAALPSLKEVVSIGHRLRDGAIALAVGGMVTTLLLAVLHQPFTNRMGSFYQEFSYSEAQGRNIVNTILVDFRALDTLGEIVVLLIAGFGIFTLLRLKRTSAAATDRSSVSTPTIEQVSS